MLWLCLPVWLDILIIKIWRSRDKCIDRAFPKVKNSLVCAKFPMSSKFHFSQWKTYFTKFIDNFLKFVETEYLNHYFKFKMWPALCKFSILFSTVKLRLGRINFLSSSIGALGLLNLGIRLYFQVFDNSHRDLKLRFLNDAVAGLSNS